MKSRWCLTLADVSDLVLVLFFAGFVVWYLLDTFDASPRMGNVIFITPVSVLGLVLSLIILSQILKRVFTGEQPLGQPADAEGSDVSAVSSGTTSRLGGLWHRARPGIVAVLFVGYVFSLERIGFDVATFVFVVMGLLVLGERNLIVIFSYTLLFTIALILAFRWLLPYPMLTLVL